ncbi:MAG TPA: DUF4105 domain-containing protein, partial [Candidatus Manganitrophaceae bacterium]
NPSSMFGHTLLRIDRKDQTEQTRILDYTVNYAATVTTENGVLFAVLGIIGGFKGSFSTIPYYMQVQKYSDMESRDIWEYHLRLTEDQVKRMLMHAWELGNTDFDYYFFTKNCSYQLLPLLEAADPDLRLAASFKGWTIPADTVRAITQTPGLVTDIVYRPSRSAQIRQRRALLTEGEKGLLSEIIAAPSHITSETIQRLPPDRRALLLEIAFDYLRFRTFKLENESESEKKSRRALLQARSALKAASPEIDFRPDVAPPEKGHETARVGLGTGWRKGEPFEEVWIRPAYHDLLDDDAGYTPGAQIELMNTRLRYYHHRDRLELHSLNLADVISLFPVDPLFRKPSWK